MKVQHSNLQTDAELLKEFSGSGSHSAFAALVERHGPMIHAVAMRTLSNHHDAQDVTQATFLVLAREAEVLSRKPSVAGWLHTVARRLSLDAYRSRESRQRREAAAMNEPVNTTRDAISTGFRRELDAALDCLPDRYRHPLVLFHLEGASLDEVARRLDLQPSTLRTRLSRARDMLRHILVRRGVEVASVGALSAFFAAEAKAAALTPTFVASVVTAATGNGVGVSTRILQLAGKAACGTKPISITTAITSITILMKTKATLVTAILVALAAAGTTAYVVNHGNTGTRSETQGADHRNLASQAEGHDGKKRQRAPHPSGGKAETLSTEEAKKKLIEQCIRQMTESSADGTGKAMAFHMLQKLGPDAKSAVPALTKALDHEDSYVRIQSAYTLWKVDQQAKAIPLLSKALKDTEIKIEERAMAASSLGEIGPSAKAALPALREATKDQEALIRVSAARALWTVDQQSELAKPVLIDALKNDDLNVFSSAAWALGEVGFDEPGLTALGKAIRDDPTRNSKASASRRALPGLANALNSNGSGIRREAISVMSLMSETISLFGDRDTGARAAIIALTKTKKDDEDPAIRAAAAEVLKKIDPEVVAKAGTENGGKKNPTTDLSDAEVVAKAFITALANQNVAEAAKYIIPEERDELKKELNKGIPPLPKDPKVQIRLKENGTQADVLLLNAQKPASGPPFGLNMKFSNGKWWIVK